MEGIYWILVGLIIYVYAGYPLLLLALPKRTVTGMRADDDAWPMITLLISAYNEANCIKEKIENSVSLDYPETRLQVICVSDASDDGTDQIIEGFADSRVSLLRMEERSGKTVGLNAGVRDSHGEIIVFADANAMYKPDALKNIVAPFADPRIGAVIGESTYIDTNSQSGQSESLYWKYETAIKRLESRVGSVVGGDGAIYGVRRSLYQEMNPGDLSDFVNPMQVVQAGYRCVYQPSAISCEEAATYFVGEFGRKVRIVNRAWRALWKMRAMLNPFRFGFFSLKLWSHKVLRWLVPFMLFGLFLVNLGLARQHYVYAFTMVGQLVFYGLAIFGYNNRNRQTQSAIVRIPFYFCLVNVAAAVALIGVLSGRSYTTWATVRT